MSIVFYCPECGQKLRIGDEFAGKPAACVRCNLALRVPEKSQARSRHEMPPETERFEPPRETERFEPETERFAPGHVIPGDVISEREEPEAQEPVDPAEPEPFEPETGRFEPERAESQRKERGAPTALEPAQRGETTAPARKKKREAPLLPPRPKIDFEELIDMTSMVDIVFFLLIFFLVTSMKTIDSSIPMPSPDQKKAASAQPKTLSEIDADEGQIVVRIDQNDTIFVEGAEVHNERDLLFKLRELKLGAGRPDKLLVIGHGDASHGTAVMILDAGRDIGIEQVRLAVADEQE